MTRRANDAYYTPDGAVRALLERRPALGMAGQVVVEPCVGEGAIANVFRERGCLVVTNDIVPTIDADLHDDAQAGHTWAELANQATGPTYRPVEWVVTNPPFVAALPILKRAHVAACRGVAMLLRLSFLEPTEDRGPWLAEHPPDELIVLPRISFTGDGNTDSVTCAWFIWYTGDAIPRRVSLSSAIEIVETLGDAVDDGQQALFGAKEHEAGYGHGV